MSGADETTAYDVVVVGAGPAGENVADRVRAAGLSCAVVEGELVGGECSYWACVPSKAMLRPAQALADVRRLPGAAQAVHGPLDAAAVLARRDEMVGHRHDDGQVAWVEGIGAVLVRGHGRLAGPRRVEVTAADGGVSVLAARHAVVVATGSRAVLPDLPGVADVHPWTSREATSATSVPGRLAVVGGGVVGVEMACAWQALGAQVTLLVRGAAVLEQMEPFAGELVVEGLRASGVDVRFGTSVTAVERPDPAGPVRATLDGGSVLEADEILFATGRAPRSADLGLETVGLTPGSWFATDESCRVEAVPDGWLYAVGDANRRALLTHQGKYQARIAGSAIAVRAAGGTADTGRWGAQAATADTAAVPQVVFADPEATAVGLNARQAEAAGLRTRVVDYEIGSVSGASLYAEGYRGRARMVVDLDRECVVGATFVGPGVAELLHSATVAVAGEVPIARLWHAVPAYPTISEVWLRLLEAYRDGEGKDGS
ncbi:dihydrolipoyl dehydrogenase family protein [Yinghuangia soli]|uniref:NAD(P)/FAD-dependent oxidoreductase n=1 Tax=Yinghuangia soli TaxID=2908204 RepID=A0AA41PV85_9ACTN|nr:NAD(P)/FAD-dependent oxidoreductase [Yinghuangia soli]MCF2526237.1 NAD(P)/FAD-dependent oxidoreductase [Yinghuangia soli]